MTQKQLDDLSEITHNRSVKYLIPVKLSVLLSTVALLASCGPQPANPERLLAVHEENAAIRREINRMQALIKHAGEDIPGLAEQVAAREAQIAAAIKELVALGRKETDTKLRIIELQDRLDSFRAAFRMMQNNVANN